MEKYEEAGKDRKKMAKISIIVPVYNVENYLKKCIDSLLSQTFAELEIICIDDASSDTSGEILDDYAARDNRIKVIHADENMGTLRARVIGVKVVSFDSCISILSRRRCVQELLGLKRPQDNILCLWIVMIIWKCLLVKNF